MRIKNKFPLLNLLYESLFSYPAPVNLTYFWNFGVFALICLVIQIITGLALAMHYAPNIDLAFASVEHIMRDFNYGWLIRYIHSNGASMFFIVVYIHMFRGIYYGSFVAPRQMVWVIGVAILLCMIITAFLGYVLPWGQMSFWGATVITNLFSAIPVFGQDIVTWLWGGFGVDNATLNRFYSLHFFLPFVISGLTGLHLVLLHQTGSNNPLGIVMAGDGGSSFSPYYTVKDLYGIFLFLIFYVVFLYFAPNLLGHPDNYVGANAMVTPPHIVPEWYFLPFYAILRSIPDKLAGVCALALALVLLFILPVLHQPEIRSMRFRPFSRYLFWIFIFSLIVLSWLGGQPVEQPFVFLSQVITTWFFLYMLFIQPFIIFIESILLSFEPTPTV